VPPFPDPVRLRSGQKFAKLHTFFRTHYAGWLQQVPVTAERTYRFSIYAHSWYSDCSTEPHTFPLLDDCRTPASDSHDILQVGIGPGGDEQSPLSSEIIWSDPVEIYGGYAQPLVVEATAQTDVITVWLRSWTNYALQHEDVYWDDAKLVEADAPPPPPREYERAYVLLPPAVTLEEAQDVLGTHFKDRQTIGFSADDAGVDAQNITKRSVIAYRPEAWPTDLEAFFDTYYPGLDSYEERSLGEEPPPPPPPTNDLLLAQRDDDWKDVGFGAQDCRSTIGQQGCFITCLAMAQRYYGIQDNATPLSVDEALGYTGYVCCVANWLGQSQLYKDVLELSIRRGPGVEALEHMDKGGCVMVEMLPTDVEHFMLVYEENEGFVALDPWENVERPFKLSEAQSWRILTKVNPTPPPATDTTNRISLHLQTMVPGVREFLQTARPASVKRVTGMQDLQTMKQWAPWLKTVYRHADNPEGALQFCDPQGRVTAQSLAVAGDWLATYQDSLIAVSSCGLWSRDDPFYQEGPNEYGWAAGNLDSIQRAASFERSWLIKLAELNLPVAPVCFCAGVGNIGRPGQEEEDFLLLLDLAKETAAMDGAFGLHSYWTPGMLTENWKYLAGRFEWIDEVLSANGVRNLKWFLGEGGIAGCLNNPIPLEMAGWRADCSWRGDWDKYIAEILEANRRYQLWNSTHGNRCIVLNLFTTGIGVGWLSFLLKTEEINALALALS